MFKSFLLNNCKQNITSLSFLVGTTVVPVVCEGSVSGQCLVCRARFPFQLHCTQLSKSFLLYFSCLVLCIVIVALRTVPWIGLQCVIVAFPDHNHFLISAYTVC